MNNYITILNYFNNKSTNASAESFNSKIKAFRTQFRGVTDIKFFLFRVAKIYAWSWKNTIFTGDPLNGEVEVDETYVGGKNKNRHVSKKVKSSRGRSVKDKTPVLGMIERNGKLVAKTVENTSAREITPEIVKRVKNAILYTDEWLGYNTVDKMYEHFIVKHENGEYVNGKAYTNTIEGFWSLLKRDIFGIYHFTSKKHLQRYVDEFVFRYNLRGMSDGNRFNLFLCKSEYRITYKELVYEQTAWKE